MFDVTCSCDRRSYLWKLSYNQWRFKCSYVYYSVYLELLLLSHGKSSACGPHINIIALPIQRAIESIREAPLRVLWWGTLLVCDGLMATSKAIMLISAFYTTPTWIPCHLIGRLLVTWYSIDGILHGRAFLVTCAVHFWLYADCVPLCCMCARVSLRVSDAKAICM